MKEADLKFPMTIDWYGDKYRIVEGETGLDWTILQEDGSDGMTYKNSAGRAMIVDGIGSGNATILSQPTEVIASFGIDVDSSKLAEAVRLAGELEATLIRIKALLA